MTEKQPKRPRDLDQWAKRMLDIATGEASDRAPTPWVGEAACSALATSAAALIANASRASFKSAVAATA